MKRVDSKKKSVSEVPKPVDSRDDKKRIPSAEEVDNDSPKHVKIKEESKPKRKESSDEDFEMGKGLNGEPSMIKVTFCFTVSLIIIET